MVSIIITHIMIILKSATYYGPKITAPLRKDGQTKFSYRVPILDVNP